MQTELPQTQDVHDEYLNDQGEHYYKKIKDKGKSSKKLSRENRRQQTDYFIIIK